MNPVPLLLNCTDQGCGSAYGTSLLASCLPRLCHSAPSYTVPRQRPRHSTGQGLPSKAFWTRLPPFISSCWCFSPVASGRRGQPWSLTSSEASWGRTSCFCGGGKQREGQESCCKPGQIPPTAAAANQAPAVSSRRRGNGLTARFL